MNVFIKKAIISFGYQSYKNSPRVLNKKFRIIKYSFQWGVQICGFYLTFTKSINNKSGAKNDYKN